jgi:DNA-binding GntR family transcriptional regulator
MSEHRAIVTALARGDLGRAEDILDEHISRMHIGFRAAHRRQALDRPDGRRRIG